MVNSCLIFCIFANQSVCNWTINRSQRFQNAFT
ncbi:Uncharacterised protein [Vibrio cholerae]|nr:Uncharacterised protein [Vibrio cholerae]